MSPRALIRVGEPKAKKYPLERIRTRDRSNNFPVVIPNVQEFFDNVVSVYFEALNEYSAKFAEIKSKRKIEDMVGLWATAL